MQIGNIVQFLENNYPPSLQESYDNCGLICGSLEMECHGVLCTLDVTEDVVNHAIELGYNFIIAHHPIIFKPLKSLSAKTHVEKTLLLSIKNDIAIYALHTNYDNVISGVNLALAKKIALKTSSLRILAPMPGKIAKLFTYVPVLHKNRVKDALFSAGAGEIGAYSECSFETTGTGTFKPLENSNPFIGTAGGGQEQVNEAKIEVIFPIWRKQAVLSALKASHPYEEVAYEIIVTENDHAGLGSGMIGELPQAMEIGDFLTHLKEKLNLTTLRFNKDCKQKIFKVAVCGGAGAFLIKKAIAQNADAYITADLTYHHFFESGKNMALIDVGHYESEIAAIDQLVSELQNNFITFAIQKTNINTNPIHFY